MNKKALIIGLLTSSLLLTSCNDNNNGKNNSIAVMDNGVSNTYTSTVTTTNTEDNIDSVSIDNINLDDYVTVGEIIEINKNEVHVITGDIAEIFKVASDDLKNFYLGQTVSVTEEGPDQYSLMPFNNKDFLQRYTNMGHMINRLSGTVLSVTEETAKLMTDKGEIIVRISDSADLEENIEYEFDIIEFDEDDSFLMEAYDINNKLPLTINDLTRLENGELQILAVDKNNSEYTINTYYPVRNFNLTDLAIGQKIDVYASSIMESYPAQVNASRIDLLSNLSRGTSTIDYEVIGEVIEIKGREVHILQGDMVQIFNIDPSLLDTIYLGETVRLFDNNDSIAIESYIVDQSLVHTNMGMIITTIEGLVTQVTPTDDGHTISIQTNDGLIACTLYGEQLPEENKNYEFDTMSYDGTEISIITFYDPQSIINITVTSLSKASNGELIFNGKDENDGEYTIATSRPKKNFNLSELKVGDVLEVYADEIMESWPMQVNTRKINMK